MSIKARSIILGFTVLLPVFANAATFKIFTEAKPNSVGWYTPASYLAASVDLQKICDAQLHGTLASTSIQKALADKGNVVLGSCVTDDGK